MCNYNVLVYLCYQMLMMLEIGVKMNEVDHRHPFHHDNATYIKGDTLLRIV